MSSSSTFGPRIEAIQSALRHRRLDGWLLYNFRHSNIFATKLLEIPAHFTQMRRYFYFIPAAGTPVKIVHSIEQYNLDHLPGEKIIYATWESLHGALKKALSGSAVVAMEYSPQNSIPYVSKVDAGTVELVRSFGADVVSSGDIVQYFEARWTEKQRREQFESAEILRATVDVAFGFIGERLRTHKSVTEYDVQQRMTEFFTERGLTYSEPPNCSVNANSANPHYEPTKQIFSEIRKGDFILIDLWAKKPDSVYADITWVAYAGDTPPPRYAEVFDIVKQARDNAVEYLRRELASGHTVRGCDVDDIARQCISDHGYAEYFVHRTGHSIGEEVHGNGANIDNFETHDQREIIPETCFSIEPGIYLPGEFGVRLEINVYISKDKEVIIPGQPIQQEIVRIAC